ncbi:zinc finger, CCHC-type [Artemisia annua]|uniref:Zinc finger, CCHC-type n=1 Tax=Artemisia annua TaxID=35608 RepID=A0A2U1MKF3_ARTAN|nr:zinc finger, CCHC-type [Artemisia annua]
MTRKGLVEGIPRINHAGQICDACLLGKHSRTPFPNQAKFRSKNPLDLVYGDLCGPISPATHSGKKLIFLLVDDCTRFMWAYFLTSKDQAFNTFKEFRQKIEMELRLKIRMLRTDRGGEFTSNEFTKYCTRALEDETPYEALYNRKPNLENLRIFGCTAYAKITVPHLKKLDDRSIPMVYLGVEEGSKACRLYDPVGKKKHVSRDVKFMETKPWDWDKSEEDTSTQDSFWASFVVDGVDNAIPTQVNLENNENPYPIPDPLPDPTSEPDSPIVASIEQTSDLNDITLDEITGKLKAFEERIKLRKGGQAESQDNLLFAQGEHSRNKKQFNKYRGKSNYSRGNWKNKGNRDNSNGENSTHNDKPNTNKGGWKKKVKCFNCGKHGHFKRDCRSPTTTQEQSNLILEDDEPSLLMTTHEEVLLNERQIQPGKYATTDASIWYLYNGASNHMTGTKSHFKDIDESITGRVRFGDGSYVEIKGRGSILLGCRNNEQKIISEVYYIPNLKSNILSLGQLTEIGCKIIMDGNKLTLYDKNKKLLMKVERSKNRLYSIRLQIEAPLCLLANVDNQAWLWHARLGHLNFDDINKMIRKGLVEGIPRINHAGQICDACLLGKHSRTPFPNQAKFRSKNPLDLVYGDLCGPISPATHSGKKLIFLLVDDCTRFMWAYFLTSKDQAFNTFKKFRQKIEMELRLKTRMLRTDRGGEFTSNEFTKYCKDNGIARQLIAPYSPQQNGVVERKNRTVLSTTRSMMKAMKLPLTFWAEAVKHAIYILNRVPTRALEDKTPYEALYNRKPNLENLRIFGCTAYAKITIPHLKKLDDRSIPMVYLGVEEGSKASRLYDPVGKKKHVSRDVKFMETKPWDWDKSEEDTCTQDSFWASFVVDGVDNAIPTQVNLENNENPYPIPDPLPDPTTEPDSPVTPPTYNYDPNSEDEIEATTISSLGSSRHRYDHSPVRGLKDLAEIYATAQQVEAPSLLFTEEEPRNYKEASKDEKWIEAMEIELDSINKNNTWTLTTLPTNQKAIGLKWVYKTKRDA